MISALFHFPPNIPKFQQKNRSTNDRQASDLDMKHLRLSRFARIGQNGLDFHPKRSLVLIDLKVQIGGLFQK